jgi:RHS repeat-associated protein
MRRTRSSARLTIQPGNLLTDPSFNTNSYVYNAENQMTQKDTNLSLYYDGDGKRVEKSDNVLYWYGADGSALDVTNLQGVTTGTAASEYIYFGGRRIAKRDGPGDVYYYFGDHLQTVRSMAEVPQGQSTATLCYDADFYPFSGDPRLVISVCQNPNFLFTGKEHDTEDNLDYFGARYYSAQMGRFMTPDWAEKPVNVPYAHFGNPQSLNLYSYVQNDPTTVGDPDGHEGPDASWQTDPKAKANGVAKNQIPLGGAPPPPDPANVHTEAAPATSTTAAQGIHEPRPSVTAATDAAGIVGIVAPKVSENLHLGPAAAIVSISNDPSKTNVVVNILGLAKGFDAPMAITGAFNDAFDYGINHSNGRIDNGASLIPATVSNGEMSIRNPDLDPCGGMCNN